MTTQTASKKASRNDWHPAQVIAELRIRCGISLRRLAVQHGVNHKALSRALVDTAPLSEKRIADALGLHPADIWLSRYNPDGTLPTRRGRKPSITVAPKPITANAKGKVSSCRSAAPLKGGKS